MSSQSFFQGRWFLAALVVLALSPRTNGDIIYCPSGTFANTTNYLFVVFLVVLSQPRLQAVMLPLLAVAMQATGAMQAHQEDPAPRVGRVHTKCRRAT